MIGWLKWSGGLHIWVDHHNVPCERLLVESSLIWGVSSECMATDSKVLDGISHVHPGVVQVIR